MMEGEREAVLENVGDFVLDELFLERDVDVALIADFDLFDDVIFMLDLDDFFG